MTEHLEAPFDGTPEAKAAATRAIFDTFPGLEARALDLVAKAKARQSEAAADDTDGPYPSGVDRDAARGDA